MTSSHSPRLLGQKQNKFLLTVCLCALTAALIFLPFYLLDGGFFHYAGDFNSQQISFYRYMNGFLKGLGYPDGAGSVHNTFSWATDLGSGALNAYSFYLYGSPFFWFSLLFPQRWLPYLMVPLLVLKFAVAGGGAYLYLRRYVKDQNYAVLGAVLYAFSGWGLYNIFFNHFIDVLALFPWMLWALDEAVYHGRHGLFAFWVGVNLLNNYFFFVGQVLFLLLYFICKVSAGDFKLTPRLFVHLAFESLLGVGLGAVILWPAVLSLLQNPRTIDLSSGWGFLTYAKPQQYLAILLSWILPPDSPYMTSIWSEGVIKWTSMTAYLPLQSGRCSGLLARPAGRQQKADRCHLRRFCAGACAEQRLLRPQFQLLRPVVLYAGAHPGRHDHQRTGRPRRRAGPPGPEHQWARHCHAGLCAGAGAGCRREKWSLGVLQNPGQYAAVFGFALIGLLVYRWVTQRWRQDKRLPQRMLAAVLAFSCLFGITHIGIGKFGQWNTDSDLVEEYTSALALKEDLPEGDWRIDTYKTHDNLGLWLDECLQYFGSTAAPSILSFYPALGVKRDVSQPELSNYALRGLLSVKYLITKPDRQADFLEEADEGWAYYDTLDGYTLYENTNYVPMGFTYDYYLTEDDYESTVTVTRSNLLMRALVLSDADAAAYSQYSNRPPLS